MPGVGGTLSDFDDFAGVAMDSSSSFKFFTAVHVSDGGVFDVVDKAFAADGAAGVACLGGVRWIGDGDVRPFDGEGDEDSFLRGVGDLELEDEEAVLHTERLL